LASTAGGCRINANYYCYLLFIVLYPNLAPVSAGFLSYGGKQIINAIQSFSNTRVPLSGNSLKHNSTKIFYFALLVKKKEITRNKF
jgi:hypothetical protein